MEPHDMPGSASNDDPPESITCPDCLGTAHRISYRPHEGWEPGDVVAYRCSDCLDRWDLEIPDPEDASFDG